MKNQVDSRDSSISQLSEAYLIQLINPQEMSTDDTASLDDITDLFSEETMEFASSYFFSSRSYHLITAILKLPINSAELNELFVFTPVHYFGFRLNGSKIDDMPTRYGHDELGAHGTIEDAIRQLGNLIKRNSGKGTSITALFLNEESKINVQEKLQPYSPKEQIRDLRVENNEIVRLYQYSMS